MVNVTRVLVVKVTRGTDGALSSGRGLVGSHSGLEKGTRNLILRKYNQRRHQRVESGEESVEDQFFIKSSSEYCEHCDERYEKKMLALLVARLSEAGAAGGRGENCGIDDINVVIPTFASTVCTVQRGIGVS